jgi:excisionase family DNA binding protein
MNEIQKPLSVQQAADFLNLKPSYIYNLVFFGKLKAYKPSGKKLIFKVSDLERYAYGNPVGGHTERANAILNAKKETAHKSKSVRKFGT